MAEHSYLQPILAMSQLYVQLSENAALIASVLDLHARPSGVSLLRGLYISVTPHASSTLWIQGVQILVLLHTGTAHIDQKCRGSIRIQNPIRQGQGCNVLAFLAFITHIDINHVSMLPQS